MARVKTGYTRRAGHKKVLELTKGYRMTKNRLYKVAHEALLHAGEYAFAGRHLRKRDMRKLWTTRIQAALLAQEKPISYSRFVNILKIKNIQLNRKSLSDLAQNHPTIFSTLFKFTSD